MLATYIERVSGISPDNYPGSPLLVARELRPQDRLVAIEKGHDPRDFALKAWGEQRYYEVCCNPTIYEYVDAAHEKQGIHS